MGHVDRQAVARQEARALNEVPNVMVNVRLAAGHAPELHI